MRATEGGVAVFFLQDSGAYAHSCREPARQQVLAGRRQGQELDLLGSFPWKSSSFQHTQTHKHTLNHTHPSPPNSTGTEREKEVERQKVWSERGMR